MDGVVVDAIQESANKLTGWRSGRKLRQVLGRVFHSVCESIDTIG